MLLRSVAKRITSGAVAARQSLAQPAVNKPFSTVAANSIHITFVDQEVSRLDSPPIISFNIYLLHPIYIYIYIYMWEHDLITSIESIH